MSSSHPHQPVEVSTAVSSILAAFNSGLDIAKRLVRSPRHIKRSKQRQNTGSSGIIGEDDGGDAGLKISLMNGSHHIEEEYRRSVERFGVLAQRGDEKATTSLAHTLLILNTGLTTIINALLFQPNPKSGQHSHDTLTRQSLLNLSNASAAQTVLALNELQERIIQGSISSLTLPMATSRREQGDRRRRRHAEVMAGGTQRQQSKPQLKGVAISTKRGAWVRPLASPSSTSSTPCLSNASASSLPQKKKTVNTSSTSNKKRKGKSSNESMEMAMDDRVRFQMADPTSLMGRVTTNTAPAATSQPKTKHSRQKRKKKSTPGHQFLPPIPPIPPLSLPETSPTQTHNPHLPSRPPPPPPPPPYTNIPIPPIPTTHPLASSTKPKDRTSLYSFLSDSTKIGEIPEERWLRARGGRVGGGVAEGGVGAVEYGDGWGGWAGFAEGGVGSGGNGNGKRGWRFWKKRGGD